MRVCNDVRFGAIRFGIQLADSIRLACLVGFVILGLTSDASAQLTALTVVDYATAPMSGSIAFPSATANSAYLARLNFMADDPADSNRFFVNDLNGQLRILDKTTNTFTEYLNFNGAGAASGLYDRLFTSAGFAGGFVTFQFDPNYVNNGKFYTVHVESGTSGVELPSNANYPNLDLTNYGVTPSVDAPGGNTYKDVLVEWTDTNVNNSTFEGSARELLRFDARDRIHPMGDIIFNPTAGPSDPDWRVMYISVGDAGNGEQSDAAIRRTPQLLNTLGGKILRITPDTNVNITTTASPNGKYQIPTDNPFTGVADHAPGTNTAVRDEIWALGFRNPHRMTWDVDPADPNPTTNNRLIVNDIGLHTWEEVNIVREGENYGYSPREGNELLQTNNATTSLPGTDTIPHEQICSGSGFTTCTSNGTVTPIYPVAQYGHEASASPIKGDAITSGYVYRGSKIPQLYGKYLFGDITTGGIFYADFDDLQAADDGNPATLATIHSLDILWDNPNDAPNDGEELYTTLVTAGPNAVRGPMFQIIEAAYEFRGGLDPNLPGTADVTGGASGYGRADIRLQIDAEGELYILSKSDGMIRQIVGPDPLVGDYNYDGAVDIEDYDVWRAAFDTSVPVPGLWADGNEDGFVDAADFTVWRDHMMEVVEEGGGSGAVPEPTAIALLGAGLCLAAAISRRRA